MCYNALVKKEVIIIKTVILDIIIKNNEEKIKYSNINANIIDNTITFNIEDDNYTMNIDDGVSLHKENNESILELLFSLNKETSGTYFIKDMNYNMDARVKTLELIKTCDSIYVNYKFNLQEEDLGIYSLNINIKE